MKKNLVKIFAIVMSAVSCSCSSVDDEAPVMESRSDVEVITDADCVMLKSRTSQDLEWKQILKFKDYASYERVVAQLQEMDENQRMDYFEQLGFEGAYLILKKADAELDEIFDDDTIDSTEFSSKLEEIKAKYSEVLSFENEMEGDVTPHLKFNDPEKELVGSAEGFVVIGEEIVEPQDGIQPLGEIVKTCEVSVKNGDYKSFLSVGRIGIYFAFKTQTYKKKFLSIKRDTNCGHDAYLEISDRTGVRISEIIKTKTGKWKLNLRGDEINGVNVTVKIVDFSCTRNPDNKASKTFENIVMK